jgi:LysW-gamma-L-alpha-aminoadipyl-6-phosphate/LysW-L-glutamyl-5-phosphate reductase
MKTAAIVGAAGYVGGELLRLLLTHPRIEVVAATSTRFAGCPVDRVHPNLRQLTKLSFIHPSDLGRADVVFAALGHRESMSLVPGMTGLAGTLVDLSGAFRLGDPVLYQRYYGLPHPSPGLLGSFVGGLPELHRERLRTAELVSVAGCMATAAILALYPAAVDGLIGPKVTVDARTGSSGAGASAGRENAHPERTGVMRVFAPVSHRHEAEVAQATGLDIAMTATGLQAVRGVQVVCRAALTAGVGEAALRESYRFRYRGEPFVRVLAEQPGPYRLPDPKILAGTNFCDVGIAVAPGAAEVLLVSALDNLVKGGAGNAVQCYNIRSGWPEHCGLDFAGLHPA